MDADDEGAAAPAAESESQGEPAAPDEPVDAVGASASDDDGSSEDGTPPAARKRKRPFWRELPVLIVLAFVLALLIKTFVVQAFSIPSSSMENTLQIGDRVLVNKVVYHLRPIHRGDVIVFNGEGSWDPDVDSGSSNPVTAAWHAIEGLVGVEAGQTDYVKRVIGLPGDRVACAGPGRPITVNGRPLAESSYLYRNPQTGLLDQPSEMPFKAVVPPGEVWVMGDHREVSWDSRGHVGDPGGGAIPEDKVIGRAFVVVWPPSRMGVLPIPGTFEKAAAVGTPLGVGVLGAFPLVLVRRRLRHDRER
jgi:signal peptidase I